MKRNLFLLIVIFVVAGKAYACTTCTIGQLGPLGKVNSQEKKISFEYMFEQNNWKTMDAHKAHGLHHAGHDVHDKTTEDFHYFKWGYRPTERLKMTLDFPYVVRRSLEVDNHSILGSRQRSQGPGDAHLIGDYRLWIKDAQSLGVLGGLKLPTGATKEKNSVGDLFEPELQPGSGSLDYILGMVYQIEAKRVVLTANTSYVFINKGEQEFRAGDVLTLSLSADYFLNPNVRFFKNRFGINAVCQNEQKDVSHDMKVKDSGGATLLMGPVLRCEANKHMSFVSSILFPAYQNLGGVHQELDYQWTLRSEINW